MTIAQKLNSLLPKARPDRAVEEQPMFLQHAANLILQISADAD
jgi:hypothetical protein